MSKMLRNYQYLVGNNLDRSFEGASLKEYVEGVTGAAVTNLLGMAPEELDTLGELAAAIQNNPDFLTTLQGRDADLLEAIGIGPGAKNVGDLSTSELPDDETVKALFEAIGEAARRLREGLGVAQGDSDMGTFTGSVISDNGSVKSALQELETYAESNSAAAVQTYVDQQIATGMWMFADQAAFPAAADNHGRVVHSHADGAMFYAHAGTWHKLQTDSAVDQDEATLQAAIDAVVARVDALELDPTTAAAVAAVQADVDQNELDSDAAEAALSGRLDVLEVDPTTQAAVDAVQADVDANEADSDAAEAALSLRLDALELDPTTQAAVDAVQADVDANEADSDAAEAALSLRLDALELDPTTQAAVDAVQADVDQNEADADAAIALKADIDSPTLTGVPAGPTAAAGTNTTQLATTAYVQTAVNDLIDSAPGTLDTLNEIAVALGNDPDLAGTLTTSIANLQADVDQNELDSDAADLLLSNRLDALDDLGTFTGGVIGDNRSVKEALQDLETAHESFDVTQGLEDIVQGTTNFTGFKLTGTSVLTTGDELNFVDGVTSNIQDQIDDANAAATAGAAANEVHIDNLATLSGVAKDDTDLGTFTGATIADAQTIKAALQALETAQEATQADVDQNESDADAAIAAVQADVDQNEADADAAIAAVQLDVDNNETAVNNALALKADLASPALTGTPTAPTAAGGTNTTQLATTAFVADAVSTLINSAPGALDTLNELALAIGNDANFATTVTNSIAAVQSDVDQNELDADNAIALKLDASAVSAFGLTLVDDADAATARTTLGVDAAGTDNSTDVTIAAGLDYVTLSGQELTLGSVDLTTDVTGALPVANGGTGATDAAAARTALGLSDVDNTSDADKPVSTATQTALDLKADLASPALTGVPTAPTAAADTNTTQIATTAYVQTELTALIGTAPAGLDTLGEIATALQEDTSAIENVTTLINTESGHVDNLATLSGVAKDSVNLGTFTGSTISDNGTIKAGMQELETQLEANHQAAALRTALGITENAGDPADGRGMYYDTVASKYLLSS